MPLVTEVTVLLKTFILNAKKRNTAFPFRSQVSFCIFDFSVMQAAHVCMFIPRISVGMISFSMNGHSQTECLTCSTIDA